MNIMNKIEYLTDNIIEIFKRKCICKDENSFSTYEDYITSSHIFYIDISFKELNDLSKKYWPKNISKDLIFYIRPVFGDIRLDDFVGYATYKGDQSWVTKDWIKALIKKVKRFNIENISIEDKEMFYNAFNFCYFDLPNISKFDINMISSKDCYYLNDAYVKNNKIYGIKTKFTAKNIFHLQQLLYYTILELNTLGPMNLYKLNKN